MYSVRFGHFLNFPSKYWRKACRLKPPLQDLKCMWIFRSCPLPNLSRFLLWRTEFMIGPPQPTPVFIMKNWVHGKSSPTYIRFYYKELSSWYARPNLRRFLLWRTEFMISPPQPTLVFIVKNRSSWWVLTSIYGGFHREVPGFMMKSSYKTSTERKYDPIPYNNDVRISLGKGLVILAGERSRPLRHSLEACQRATQKRLPWCL